MNPQQQMQQQQQQQQQQMQQDQHRLQQQAIQDDVRRAQEQSSIRQAAQATQGQMSNIGRRTGSGLVGRLFVIAIVVAAIFIMYQLVSNTFQ